MYLLILQYTILQTYTKKEILQLGSTIITIIDPIWTPTPIHVRSTEEPVEESISEHAFVYPSSIRRLDRRGELCEVLAFLQG